MGLALAGRSREWGPLSAFGKAAANMLELIKITRQLTRLAARANTNYTRYSRDLLWSIGKFWSGKVDGRGDLR